MKARLAVLAVLAAIVMVAGVLGRSASCSRPDPVSDGSAVSAAPLTSPELRAKLHEATRAKGAAYVARTRHKQPDGSPQYTNRLVLESSPYLLQHAHNPVDWYPVGRRGVRGRAARSDARSSSRSATPPATGAT